ncbi:DUF58 domain-containing protein [Colwellia sp. 20A7]|uniref:DUF58 domain-containing protein n=1 Tax=Colwellia sp. 20A7 TaxID=2689569 RepID=UPI00135B88CA|nr:DUF58 domain-containing protein [Colwellia sp. 20A7]
MHEFVDPKTLSRIKDLPLVAKTLAQGFLHGLHTGTQRGVGIEFSQYRVYEPGDDLSRVDWKLFARSDKYFVREAERESDINAWFVLDTSASMLQRSQISSNENSWHKLDYARCLIATAAYLAQKQGDNVGFLSLNNDNQTFLPALSGERHWQKILLGLTRLKAQNSFPVLEHVMNQLGRLQSNGIIFVISDFHQQSDEIVELVGQLSNTRTDVVTIQLTCDDEELFPYKGAIRFEDLESKEQVLVSANQVKEKYYVEKQKYQTDLLTRLTKNKVKHFIANIDEPLDQTLFDILTMRNKAVIK